jgi:adenylate cyclase class 2
MFLLPISSVVRPETGVKYDKKYGCSKTSVFGTTILKNTEQNNYRNIMGIEMELKARVEKQVCKKRLETIAGQGAAFVKDDAYWFPENPSPAKPENSPPGLSRSGLRVRREKKAGKETILVTWKTKEKRGGMEINDEKEFTVSRGTLFEELLYALGLRKKITKHKEGWAWAIDGVTAELAEVSGTRCGETPETLGWFLELEILDDADESSARRRLLDALTKAGIGEASIENRYYSELLTARESPPA